MQLLTPTEEKMWEKTPSLNHITLSDKEINYKYEILVVLTRKAFYTLNTR